MSDREGGEHHGTNQAAEKGRRMSDVEGGEHHGTNQAADADLAVGRLPQMVSALGALGRQLTTGGGRTRETEEKEEHEAHSVYPGPRSGFRNLLDLAECAER